MMHALKRLYIHLPQKLGLLSPSECWQVYFSGYFDRQWYLRTNPDVAKARVNPFIHFMKFGAFEGRSPGPNFNTAWYVSHYSDMASSKINPLLHYLRFGIKEGRQPNPTFDPVFNMSLDTPVAEAAVDPNRNAQRRLMESWVQGFSKKESVRQQRFLMPKKLRAAKVAIGFVTYNNEPDELQKALNSVDVALGELPFSKPHIRLLIENGAGAPEAAAKKFKFRVLPSQGNIGFGAGHNVLMQAAFEAGADYYLMANPDGAFHPSAILNLMEMAQANKDASLIEATQFPFEHPKYFDPSDFSTNWASGACLLVPKKIYKEIGGFDETFFMYCEDVDLSWRARHLGFGVKICPRALFFHDVGDRPYNPVTQSYFFRSGVALARKWKNRDFEKAILKQAQGLKLDLGNLPQPRQELESKVPDFSNNFTFALARW